MFVVRCKKPEVGLIFRGENRDTDEGAQDGLSLEKVGGVFHN